MKKKTKISLVKGKWNLNSTDTNYSYLTFILLLMNVSTQKTILRNFIKDLLTWQEMSHNFEATSKSIFQTIEIDEPPNNNLSNPSINLYKYLLQYQFNKLLIFFRNTMCSSLIDHLCKYQKISTCRCFLYKLKWVTAKIIQNICKTTQHIKSKMDLWYHNALLMVPYFPKTITNQMET